MIKQEKVQILCATMYQTDLSKYQEMHISNCDVIFANQADSYFYQEEEKPDSKIKMLTTATRGVGKNRNFAIALSSAEILLFADDDMRYEADAIEIIKRAFRCFPNAEMIVFGIRYAKNGVAFKKRLPKTGKLSFFKALRYGTCAIAIRRNSLLRCNLHFSELFGGGCQYSYGEDTDFIVQCYRKGLKVYAWGEIIATTNKDRSTCYIGYGEKYYFDKGALARHSLGVIAFPYLLRMARKKMESELNFFKRLHFLWAGYQCFPKLISYESWSEKAHEKDRDRQ